MSKEREAFEKLPKIAEMLQDEDSHWCEKREMYVNERVFQDSETGYLNGAWMAWQAAKAQAVPEGFGDIQSWIAVNSFSALDASMDDFPVVDANELAKYIDRLIEPQQPSSTSDCPDEP